MHASGTRRIETQTWTKQTGSNAQTQSQLHTATSVAPTTAAMNVDARWGMALVFVLMGYEWLVSGIDKIFSSDFRSGLASELEGSLSGNPHGWYVHVLNRIVLPHAAGFAVVIEIGEVLVALGMFLGAALWIGGDHFGERWTRTLRPWVLAALIGSALMTANYYLLGGGGFPGINTGAPFDEALNIDGLLTLVALGLIGIQLLAWRAVSLTARRQVPNQLPKLGF